MGTGIKGKRKEEKKKNVHTVREERKRERVCGLWRNPVEGK